MSRINSTGTATRKLAAAVSIQDYVRIRTIVVRDGCTMQDWFLKLIKAEIERDESNAKD